MTEAIHDGRAKPEGVSWTVSTIHPSELFWRQLRFGKFDVSEMSLSSPRHRDIERKRGLDSSACLHRAAVLPYQHPGQGGR
jgi:4,5-dihydroxyphthalate decarboxylase